MLDSPRFPRRGVALLSPRQRFTGGQLEHPEYRLPVHELGVDDKAQVVLHDEVRQLASNDFKKGARSHWPRCTPARSPKYPLGKPPSTVFSRKFATPFAFAQQQGCASIRDLKRENVMIGDYGEGVGDGLGAGQGDGIPTAQ